MKKNLNLILVLLCLVFLSCGDKNDKFYDTILETVGRNSFYVVIGIKSNEFEGKAIVTNNDLYDFLSRKEKIGLLQYKTLIKQKLEMQTLLEVEKENVEKYNFVKVKYINTVESNAKGGMDKFIDIYFYNKVLKSNTSDEERSAIISKLFSWKIPCKIDDESGYLTIRE